MPCICYGAVSGNEQLDAYLKTDEGKRTMELLKEVAYRIKNANIHVECMPQDFYTSFQQAFHHLLYHCPEKGK